MPTLLSVNNYHYHRAGAEAVYLDHNRLFEDNGWSVVPFAMNHPDNIPTKWSAYFANELEFGHDYSPLDKLRMAPKTIYSFEAQRKIASLIRKAKPAMCHMHNIYHHLSPSILSTVRAEGVPVVLTTHDLKIACPAYKMMNSSGVCERCKGGALRNVVANRCIKGSLALSTLVYFESKLHRWLDSYRKHVNQFVSPSKFLIDKFEEWGFDRKQMTHIPNTVDVSQYQVRDRSESFFLFAGRLAEEKGVSTLLKAAHLAKVPLKILGGGPEESRLKQLNEDLSGDAEFLGHVSSSKVMELLRGAKALVLPSECYENAPISILEAYATGVPVIGANIGGIPEMISQGETGETFTSGDVDALAAALVKMAALPEAANRTLGQNARQMVADQYDRNKYLSRTLELYERLGVAA